MLIYGLVVLATLLRFRIYGRVLTFRRSSDLSTGFGMYHNKQWMEYGEKLVPQLLLTSKISRKWLTQHKILNLRQEVRFSEADGTKNLQPRNLFNLTFILGQRTRKKGARNTCSWIFRKRGIMQIKYLFLQVFYLLLLVLGYLPF